MNLYCYSQEGHKVKVGSIVSDPLSDKRVFFKNKPHLMKVIAPNGAYGIQRHCTDDNGKAIDLHDFFSKNPELEIVISDWDTHKNYVATAKDWIEHEHKGNYGDGTQMFLSVDYMKED